MGASKKILVTMSVAEVEVPEDWTEEQVRSFLDQSRPGWSEWKHADEWRN